MKCFFPPTLRFLRDSSPSHDGTGMDSSSFSWRGGEWVPGRADRDTQSWMPPVHHSAVGLLVSGFGVPTWSLLLMPMVTLCRTDLASWPVSSGPIYFSSHNAEGQ